VFSIKDIVETSISPICGREGRRSLRKDRPRLTMVLALLIIAILYRVGAGLLIKGELVGWQVDVYTQKAPHSGVGLGEPSDAFAYQENVFLDANVTYNMYPVQNILVSFQVFGPPNPKQNVTFAMSASSGSTGIAQTNFTISWPEKDPETVTFGNWTVFAYIQNASDSLVFRVGWIVEVVSLAAANADPPVGGWLAAQLSLRNIAMTPKSVTLSMVLIDHSGTLIGGLVVENLTVDVEDTNLSYTFQIPYWVSPGVATLNVSLLAANGAPFCPSAPTTFLITFVGDVNGDGKVDITDLAMASAAFGSYPGHPRWDPRADVSKDNRIDILDIARVSANFGKTSP
jgi:hypothetical protein